MAAYVIRRVLLTIPTLLLVSLIVFATIRFIPGSVLHILAGESGITGDVDAIKERLGIDKPVFQQYIEWIGGVLRGDLGTSMLTGQPAWEALRDRIPVTMEIASIALLVGIFIGIPIGILSAIRQDTPLDYAGRSFAIGLVSIPNFWMASMVIVLPAYFWGVIPGGRWVPFTENPIENLKVAIVPAIVLGVHLAGGTMRMTRTMMLETLRQDYIRTARAKGLRSSVIIMRHALRNALIPVVTIIGAQVPILIGGSAITEQVFGIPGMGQLAVSVLSNRDYTMLSAINLVFASFVVLVNLLVDLTYVLFDPRIRYS